MKLDSESLITLQKKLIGFASKYAVFIFVILSLGVFGFLVYRIRTLAAQEPSESMIAEKAGETRPASIDKKSVERIQELQSTSVEVKTLFDQNRDNPFQE